MGAGSLGVGSYSQRCPGYVKFEMPIRHMRREVREIVGRRTPDLRGMMKAKV